MNPVSRTLRRVTRRAMTLLLIAAFLITAALTVGVFTRRFQAVPVLTGSMSPAIEAGGLAMAWNTPTSDLVAGDVIVYRAPSGSRPVIVHRIDTLDRRDGVTSITTKGDANEATDPWGEVTLNDTRTWTVTGSIAGLGELAIWARSPAAQIAAFAALVIGSALVLSDRRVRRRVREASYAQGAAPPTTDLTTRDPIHTPAPSSARVPAPHAVRRFPVDDNTARHAELARRLSQVDPRWSWRPAITDEDGEPIFGTDELGVPVDFWLEVHARGGVHLGIGTETSDAPDPRPHLVTSALIHAAANLGVDLGDAPVVAPPRGPSAHRSARSARFARSAPVRVTRRGMTVLTMLALAVIGPSASAMFTDSATDTHTVSTGSLEPPTELSAEVGFVLGSCAVDLSWLRTVSRSADGYEILRQPLELGVDALDGLGVTEPTPSGPFEVVVSVTGVDTLTGTDPLPDDTLQTATRFRYAARTIKGAWRSGLSNTADINAVGTCTTPVPPAPITDPLAPATEPIVL